MIKCPHCGENTFVKERKIMDGWQVVATVNVCALCGAKFENNGDEIFAKNAKIAELSALLGGEVVDKVKINPGDEYGKFCRNCSHFLAHPFKSVCAKSGAEVTPDGDCDKFEKKN